jgi:hypothetical protein
MKLRRAPKRYLCCFLLIITGISGVLLSPSVGVRSGVELRSFTLNKVQEYAWGRAIASTEFEIPYVQNHRGLMAMSWFLAASLVSIFGGVHWFTRLQRQLQ